jgi:hypothetical protein
MDAAERRLCTFGWFNKLIDSNVNDIARQYMRWLKTIVSPHNNSDQGLLS